MFRILVSDRAWADIDRLETWLWDHGATYATDLGHRLADAILELREYPLRTRLSGGRNRELLVGFHANQYVVRYQVHGDGVVVLRIHHALEDR